MKAAAVVGVLLGLPAAALLLLVILPDGGRGLAASSPSERSNPGAGAIPGAPGPAEAAAPAAQEKDPTKADTPPPPEHVPGSGRIVPLDLTRVAPRSFGTAPWARLATTPEAWKALYEELHAVEWRNPDPITGNPPPPAFDPAHEAVLVVGLGMRPRMDYDLMLEPIAPRHDEVRYRLKVDAFAGMVTEVVTWPAQAYRIPRAPVEKRGLAVVDEAGNEIAAFPARSR